MDPNFCFNLEDTEDYSSAQYYRHSTFSPISNQIPITENPQTSRITEKHVRGNKWDAAEDVALMSAWCMASEDNIRGKSQKKTSLWARVKELYDTTQAENTQHIGKRNEDQMRGRFKRLNENAQKWVAAYREAYRQKRSGMSLKDVENDAHKIYEANGGSKFNDSIVFNEVMSKHPKWELQVDRDITRSRTEFEVEEDSGASTKRSRTSEEGDYSTPETPNSGGSTIQRPIGRDAAKKKGKGKASNEIVSELRAMRLTRESEVEVMKKRIELDQQREQNMKEREQNMKETKLMEMQLLHLNTLLQKNMLSPEEENMKRYLMSKFYGN